MNKTKTIYSTIMLSAIFMMAFGGINNTYAEENQIPEWVKGIFVYYANGEISESELVNALEFLAENGILKLSTPIYAPFSMDDFPQTGGFNPAWLEGERDKILETCAEARSMGYENPYCQYVE